MSAEDDHFGIESLAIGSDPGLLRAIVRRAKEPAVARPVARRYVLEDDVDVLRVGPGVPDDALRDLGRNLRLHIVVLSFEPTHPNNRHSSCPFACYHRAAALLAGATAGRSSLAQTLATPLTGFS